MMIFLIVFCTVLMAIISPAMQWNLFEIETEYFRKVKIKKLSFLFRPIGGKHSINGDIQEYGVIIPMLAIQILGYLFAFLSLILTFILYFIFTVEVTTIAIIIASILGLDLLIIVGTTVTCMIITKVKRKNKKN